MGQGFLQKLLLPGRQQRERLACDLRDGLIPPPHLIEEKVCGLARAAASKGYQEAGEAFPLRPSRN